MFQDLKNAWREAVENFRRELHGEDDGAAGAHERLRAMQRDLSVAASELRRIEREIASTRSQAAAEREEEAVCRRRESLARGIDDDETAAIAARFAARHAERAAVLERKAGALEAERELLRRELADMERIVEERKLQVGDGTVADDPAAAGAAAAGPSGAGLEKDDAADAEFRRLEREQREREAQARLEELKRRMQ